jgi:hypothetical protein
LVGEKVRSDPRSREFSACSFSPRMVSGNSSSWHIENARERAFDDGRLPIHSPSTTGLNRFAENPVNGAGRGDCRQNKKRTPRSGPCSGVRGIGLIHLGDSASLQSLEGCLGSAGQAGLRSAGGEFR